MRGYIDNSEILVEQFGEVGTPDDYATVQRAIDSGHNIVFSRPSGYKIATKLTFDQDVTYTFRNGSSLIYKGDKTSRLADVNGRAVFIDPVFDGDDRQCSLSLVYWSAGSGPTYFNGKSHNLTAREHGTNLTNTIYGLGIDVNNVRDFVVKDHMFEDIISYNDSVVYGTPTEGVGFCGGIVFIPPTATDPTVLYLDYSVGVIDDCTFKNIQTIRDAGLALPDWTKYDDGDGIRFYGNRAFAPDCDVQVRRGRFIDCSKRAVKSAMKGVRFSDLYIVSTGAVPYPMSTLAKLNNDNSLVGVNAEMRNPAREVTSAVQLAILDDGNTKVTVEDINVDYCQVLFETIGLNAGSVFENITVDGIRCPNVSLRAITETLNGGSNNLGIRVDNIDVRARGNNAIFAALASPWSFGSIKAENMSLKLVKDCVLDYAELILDNPSFVGNGISGYIEIGEGTGGCQIGSISVDQTGFGSSLPPNGSYFAVFYGDGSRIGKIKVKTAETAPTANYWNVLYGNGLHVGKMEMDGPMSFSVGTSDAAFGNIDSVTRLGSATTGVVALMLGSAGLSNLRIGSVTDLRPCTVASVRLLSGSTAVVIENLTSRSSSGGAAQDDTAGQLTVHNTVLWPT